MLGPQGKGRLRRAGRERFLPPDFKAASDDMLMAQQLGLLGPVFLQHMAPKTLQVCICWAPWRYICARGHAKLKVKVPGVKLYHH